MNSVPIIDLANPLYCPSVHASEFLSSIRFKHFEFPKFSFHAKLVLSFESSSQANSDTNSAKGRYSITFSNDVQNDKTLGDTEPIKCLVKRSRDSVESSSFSIEIPERPAKRTRSDSSETVSSFVLSSRADRLRLTPVIDRDCSSPTYISDSDNVIVDEKELLVNGSVAAVKNDELMVDLQKTIELLEEELFGPRIGPETSKSINALIRYLTRFLPGNRLQQHLSDLQVSTHQGIVDFLASKGQISADILNLFRSAKILRLDLSESLHDEGGLNISGKDALLVFMRPNGFHHLEEIKLSSVKLDDYDLTAFQHFSHIHTLLLDNTGIGNEAIMHLVALKNSLRNLNLAVNLKLDDDCVPCLMHLKNLRGLSTKATNISISGIRKLCESMAHTTSEGGVALEIPVSCMDYLQDLESHYALHIDPPLISDASLCCDLSPEALKRNLRTHAEHNPEICASGTRAEMVARLSTLLDDRRKDLIIRSLIFHPPRDTSKEGLL